MRVSIISAFDPIPGDDAQLIRYASLAKIFAQHNHTVNYFSSSFFHLNKIQRSFKSWQDKTTAHNITLHLIKTNSYKKNISLLRLVNHHFFAVRLKHTFKNLVSEQKPDLVIIAFPPVMSAYYLVKFCNKNKIPVVVDVQDFWPEAFRMINWVSFIYKLATLTLLRNRNSAFRNASRMSCVSETYKKLLTEYQPAENIHVVKLGFNTETFQQNLSDKWDMLQKGPVEKWIVFLGTASHNPDLSNIPSIAFKMPGYRFILLGRNQSYNRIQKDIKAKKLNNVWVIGNTTFHDIVNILSRSDAGLLFIDPRSGTSLPNKLFYYLLAGLPVISNYSNSDLIHLAKELNCIFFTDTSNDTDIINTIQKAVTLSATERNNFRNFAIQNFDSESIYTGYYNWILEIITHNKWTDDLQLV